MIKKKIKLDDAYSLKTPKDSIKLYKKWAQTYDEDFAFNSGYLSPKKISNFFKKNKISIGKVYSSEWCRCKETAFIAFNKFDDPMSPSCCL